MAFLRSNIPLIQAPMASAQGPELAIAVCQAGSSEVMVLPLVIWGMIDAAQMFS